MRKAKPHTDGSQLLRPLMYPLHLFTPFVPAATNGYCFFPLGRASGELSLYIKSKEKKSLYCDSKVHYRKAHQLYSFRNDMFNGDIKSINTICDVK